MFHLSTVNKWIFLIKILSKIIFYLLAGVATAYSILATHFSSASFAVLFKKKASGRHLEYKVVRKECVPYFQ